MLLQSNQWKGIFFKIFLQNAGYIVGGETGFVVGTTEPSGTGGAESELKWLERG